MKCIVLTFAHYISIHSLRMEGDSFLAALHRPAANFNPLPPHGGRLSFQIRNFGMCYFNPLPPHGGRLSAATTRISSPAFQSTPSAWRETGLWHKHFGLPEQFQSTPSAWRETQLEVKVEQDRPISIHSLRMEGDLPFLSFLSNFLYFNPLPPHGGRPADRPKRSAVKVFQSTPSAWRETNPAIDPSN